MQRRNLCPPDATSKSHALYLRFDAASVVVEKRKMAKNGKISGKTKSAVENDGAAPFDARSKIRT